MVKTLKSIVLRTLHASGVSGLLLDSTWRRNRLLILCYHAASPGDEHLCFPGFFMPLEMFRERLDYLRQARACVLPLHEGVDRLYSGTLPPRSVVITLDDGFYAAYKYCRPLLREYAFPSTVYLSTYYVDYNRPVFDPMCRYLLWKGVNRKLEWGEVLSEPVLLDEHGRNVVKHAIHHYAVERQLSGSDKDALLSELAGRLDFDYDSLCRGRLLHLVNVDEAAEWAREADFQLHTHRHRVSQDKKTLYEQLDENKARLQPITLGQRRHLAYPGGAYLPEYSEWLREYGLETAVTCEPGLASQDSDRMLLPRVMETASIRLHELEGWMSGVSSFLKLRRHSTSRAIFDQFLEHHRPAGISTDLPSKTVL